MRSYFLAKKAARKDPRRPHRLFSKKQNALLITSCVDGRIITAPAANVKRFFGDSLRRAASENAAPKARAALYQLPDLSFEPFDDALFQAGDIALRNAQLVRNVLLRHLLAARKPEAKVHDAPLPLGKVRQRLF